MSKTNRYFLILASAIGMSLAPLSASASTISVPTIFQANFANNTDAVPPDPLNTRVVDFLGGSSTIGFASDVNNERRMAIETIPLLHEWAYWDPSGLGANTPDGYHAGRQVQWESKFSTPSADGVTSPPNGTIDPVNLDTLGARWRLDTGSHVAQSGQGRFRITDSGVVGLRIDPTAEGGTVSGQRFHLEFAVPTGEYVVSLFQENRTRNAPSTIDFPGVPRIDVAPVPDNGQPDDYALQFIVNNDTGFDQILTYEIGDLNSTIDDLDVRFSAAFIQQVPEPSALALLLLGLPLFLRKRRK